ncbi:hypothetical protein D9M68_593860 [compost metagenome]
MAIVQRGVVETADATGGVVVLHGAHEGGFVQPDLLCEFAERVRLRAGEHGRHEAADRLLVDDRPGDLPRLLRHEPAPDRVALGPEVFALVVEALCVAVDHHAQRHAVDARADAAVVQRSTGVDGHAVGLGRVADAVRAGVEHELQKHAHVEARAPDQEVVGRPFAALVLAPGLSQPFTVGLEAPRGQHTGARLDTLAADAGRHEAPAVQLQRIDRGVVADLHAQRLGAAVIGIDQRLASPHEEGVGAGHVQCAGQRRLEIHAVAAHPVPTGGGFANDQARQVLVGQPARHLQQVLPVFLFGVGVDQHVLRRVVHAAQIARVLRIPAAPFARRRFQQQHAGAGFARHQGRAKRRVAPTYHQDVDHAIVPNSRNGLYRVGRLPDISQASTGLHES